MRRRLRAAYRGVVTGGNKVTIKTPLIATRYSLLIRWLSLSVILVALDLRKKTGSSQFLVHNAQLQNSLRKFYIKC